MKRTVALLLSLLLLLTGCSRKEAEPKPEFRLVTYTREYFTDGDLTGTMHIENTYDDDGRCIRQTQYEDGIQTEYCDYEYDENGNSSRSIAHTAEGESVTVFTYTLDDRSNILRMESYENGRLNYTEENTYDARGRIKSRTETTYWADSEPASRTLTHAYDLRGELKQLKSANTLSGSYELITYKDGKKYQMTYFEADGTVSDHFTHYYDDNGFEYQWICCGSDGAVKHTCKRQKDETGLVITELHYDAMGYPTGNHDVFTYDEYGNQLLRERYENGEISWRITQTYEQTS